MQITARMFRFKPVYFLVAVFLFFVEVFIALYMHDRLIRPYGGDYLVVIFLYCLLAAFLDISYWKLALAVLVFAFGIETLQYFDFLGKVGWKENRLARVVIGIGFEWLDILAYILGIITVIAIESVRQSAIRKSQARNIKSDQISADG